MRLLDQRSLFMFIHPVDIPKFTHLSHCTTCSLRQEKRWVGTNFFGITDHVESVGWKQNILNINIWNISSIDNLSKTVASTVSRPSLENLSFDARRTSWTWHDSWPTQKTTPVEIHETSLDFSAWEDNFLTLVMFSEVRPGSCEGQPNIVHFKRNNSEFGILEIEKNVYIVDMHLQCEKDRLGKMRIIARGEGFVCVLFDNKASSCLIETNCRLLHQILLLPMPPANLLHAKSYGHPEFRRKTYVLQETIEAQTVVPRRPRLPGKHRRYQWFDGVPCPICSTFCHLMLSPE